MMQEKALIQLGGDAIGYIEMNRYYSILAEITTGNNITILNYKDVDNTIAKVINNAKNIFRINQGGIIGTIGIIQEYFNEDVWNTEITHKNLPLINKSGIESSISVAQKKNTFITLVKEQQTEYGGSLRRIKKRTRRHKKKRGKKTRRKRTRGNRSNH
jgi:hypothetical protein